MAKTPQLSTCLEPSIVEKLDLICQKKGWKRTQFIRRAVNYFVNTFNKSNLNQKKAP